MKETDVTNQNKKILEEQIGDLGSAEPVNTKTDLGHAKYFGNTHDRGDDTLSGDDKSKETPIRGGYIEVSKDEMGDRALFYPSGWKFMIKPATVDDVKNWSSIDEERIEQVNEVFNEVLKSSLKITAENGETVSWNKINSWDRFWFLLKIREYTFDKGERKIAYDDECPHCGEKVGFELKASNLRFTVPDRDIIARYWDSERREWTINPKEYDVAGPVLHFYPPTIEKDNVVFKWLYSRAQDGKKLNESFSRFLPWLLNRVSKDDKVNEKFIVDCEATYKGWGLELFGLCDEILSTIQVAPDEKLLAICSHCGEEVESQIQFPNGIRSLFAVSGGRKKFGQK